MTKKKQSPRISVKTENFYTRMVEYEGIGGVSTFINSSIHRFSMKNPHWEYYPTYEL